MSALPSGTVTFLFTDIEGSTRLFQQHPEAMQAALARHNSLLQDTIGAHHGHVFHALGDGFCTVFEHADDAFTAALTAQRALHGESWGEVGAVRVRMGLHTGSAEARNGDYVSSLTLARAQRGGRRSWGQMLLSSAAADRVRDRLPGGTPRCNLARTSCAASPTREHLSTRSRGSPSEFPPLRSKTSPQHRRAAASVGARPTLLAGPRVGTTGQLGGGATGPRSARAAVGRAGRGQDPAAQGSGARPAERCDRLRGGCYEYEATTRTCRSSRRSVSGRAGKAPHCAQR